MGPGGGAKIEALFMGPNPEVLRGLSELAKAIYRADPATTNIRDDWRPLVKVVRPRYEESRARLAGVSRPDLANALQMHFSGYDVGVYREHDLLLPIRLRPPENERSDVEGIRDVQVWSSTAGSMIPIQQVVNGFGTVADNPIIQHRYRRKVITAQCDPRVGLASEILKRVKPQIEAIPLPVGYTLEWGGELENSANAQKGLSGSLPICILLMIATVICLFNAVREPLIIWLTVPLAIIGMTAGLLATRQAFGFMAVLGALSLIGMLIKNAIVLLDSIPPGRFGRGPHCGHRPCHPRGPRPSISSCGLCWSWCGPSPFRVDCCNAPASDGRFDRRPARTGRACREGWSGLK